MKSIKVCLIAMVIVFSGIFLLTADSPEFVRNAEAPAPVDYVFNIFNATPLSASWVSNIDFYTTITDLANHVFDYVRVEVDGVNRTMIENDTTDARTDDGKDWFWEETQFSNGTHNFRFWANDSVQFSGTNMQQFTISSGIIVNITGGTEDGYIECVDAIYAVCSVGGLGALTVYFDSYLLIGQDQVGDYLLYQIFISFNTSTLLPGLTVNFATVYMKTNTDWSTDEFNTEIYHKVGTGWWDNSSDLATSDWNTAGGMPALINDGNILDSRHYIDEKYFAVNVVSSWINTSGGNTRYVGISSMFGGAPANVELVRWYSANSSGNEPYLLLDYTANSPPVITSSCSYETFLENTLYLRQFSATDADGDPLTWIISGAYWLSINSSTGFVNGTSPGGYQEFTVTVTVSDSFATDNCTYMIAVLPITPGQAQSGIIADFSYTINSLNHEVCFTDLSHLYEPEGAINEIVSWRWAFGDGVGSTERNPTHIYEDPGVYLVMLFIEDDMNTTSFIGKYLFVPPVLQDQFKISPGLPIVLLFIIALLLFFIGLGATILYAYRGEDRTLFKAFVGIMLIIVGTFCLLLIIGIWSLFASLFW